MLKTLFIIPARGGSKGIPGKNIKPLNGKPLIYYSIDFARKFTSDSMICVSTDDQKIINTVKEYQLEVPFIRPAELATDTAGSNEVILHALNYYEKNIGTEVENVVLLQPTSPFRKEAHLQEAFSLMNNQTEMVVSVKITDANPYTVLFEEDSSGILKKVKTVEKNIDRRQDAPTVYQVNGSLYIINVMALKKCGSISNFTRKVKYVMDTYYSIDLDTMYDWHFAEFLIEKKLIEL